jgi:tRNA pseudouridine32 synthase / 23S rRNA pseudouridine746 synthase
MMQPQRRQVPLVRDGISASQVVLPCGAWPTVLAFLTARFPKRSQDHWLARCAEGEVVDEWGAPVTPERAYQPGLKVYYYRRLKDEVRLPCEATVLFQDPWLVIADKPHFLPVIPGGRYLQETLLVRLRRQLSIDTLAPLHRIDRETAGVVAFSIQPETRGRYQSLFEERQVKKTYEAIAPWRSDLNWPLYYQNRMEESDFFHQMHEVSGAWNAQTNIDVIEVRGLWAKYRLEPHSGRKHQLRLHCASLGMPILNDRLYPKVQSQDSEDWSQPLQLLARTLEFDDPITREKRYFQSCRQLLW